MKDNETIALIVRGLACLPQETPYVEFKVNNADPDAAGERISALSNMALIHSQPFGYLVWGVDDQSHAFVGTNLSFSTWKKGHEDILAYWKNLLLPSLKIQDYEIELDHKKVILLEIPAANHYATTFKKQAYCRIGSYTKNIKEYPALEKELWNKLMESSPEERIVLSSIRANSLNEYLDFAAYFSSLKLPEFSLAEDAITRFVREGFLIEEGGNLFSITALGALLFGKDLTLFNGLSGKEIRWVRYAENGRALTMGKSTFEGGYALSFEKAFNSIATLLQDVDVFNNGIRQDHFSIPLIAMREALGNILIHQDLLASGGPLVEIFPSRIEFSNPGFLSIPNDRLIDSAPNPVNPKLASFLRRINIGDTAGSGFDKIVLSLEKECLPPERIIQTPSGVRLVLSKSKPFDQLSSEDKLRGVYDHVVLRYLSGEQANNASLRSRFGLGEEGKFKISRLLSAAVTGGLIKKSGATDKKETTYLPYWA